MNDRAAVFSTDPIELMQLSLEERRKALEIQAAVDGSALRARRRVESVYGRRYR
ncbi:MAG: hypothetical protein KME10_20125 [Plectolyngbya sp. WJT66-NPBG17]|jgi:hypothetical protein|nr:hypothetical protein [Plectolyngbya sp. WJT66-NPBG17]